MRVDGRLLGMHNWGRELVELRRRTDERVYEAEAAMERWRQRADERLGEVDNMGSGAAMVIRQFVAPVVADRYVTLIAPDTRSAPTMSVRP